ncbi:hypothetical protein N1030_08920 [Desulfovibrio mangrovi]|uniref:hypothetical protein n=1 Tax=Desulfovibrio mangrovi TaxID=2976983 RepID=UPI002245A7B3|nr:hypothetical protein [Desulfovibrio mangrovi]UZP69073.1 hypothetical protein N1030_08920 [Desulfovibrio mangrovi]
MIDKTTLIATVLQRAAKLERGHCLDVRTYKRNRSVALVRTGYDAFTVIEDGFEQERWEEVSMEKLKRLLKQLLKKEFPRSHKVRLYTMSSYEEANVNRMGHGAGRFGDEDD